MFPRERPTAEREMHEGLGLFMRRDLDHIHVGCGAVGSIELSDHESSDAVEAHDTEQRRVELCQK
jgi:hypothetical protein